MVDYHHQVEWPRMTMQLQRQVQQRKNNRRRHLHYHRLFSDPICLLENEICICYQGVEVGEKREVHHWEGDIASECGTQSAVESFDSLSFGDLRYQFYGSHLLLPRLWALMFKSLQKPTQCASLILHLNFEKFHWSCNCDLEHSSQTSGNHPPSSWQISKMTSHQTKWCEILLLSLFPQFVSKEVVGYELDSLLWSDEDDVDGRSRIQRSNFGKRRCSSGMPCLFRTVATERILFQKSMWIVAHF